jgi:hypothetical protein
LFTEQCETTYGAANNGSDAKLACLALIERELLERSSNNPIHSHLECLKYLHENGSPWDECTCEYAARNGSDAKQACLALCERELLERSSNNPIHSHLECLKYAHEHGCLWNKNTYQRAAKNRHLECLYYARENGCE